MSKSAGHKKSAKNDLHALILFEIFLKLSKTTYAKKGYVYNNPIYRHLSVVALVERKLRSF